MEGARLWLSPHIAMMNWVTECIWLQFFAISETIVSVHSFEPSS